MYIPVSYLLADAPAVRYRWTGGGPVYRPGRGLLQAQISTGLPAAQQAGGDHSKAERLKASSFSAERRKALEEIKKQMEHLKQTWL